MTTVQSRSTDNDLDGVLADKVDKVHQVQAVGTENGGDIAERLSVKQYYQQ